MICCGLSWKIAPCAVSLSVTTCGTLSCVASVVIGMVAFDRLYIGVHWQSDVLGGLLLGGVGLSAAIVWLEWGALRR